MFEESNNNPFKEESPQEEIQKTSEEELKEEIKEEVKIEEKDPQAELDDLNSKYLRMAADFDNYRKRQAQEREGLLKYGAAETLTRLLTVLDTVERANDSLGGIDDCEKVKEAYSVVFKQLDDVLQKCGLEKIEAQGKQFDPNIYDAVMKTPTDEYPEGYVIAELQTGYKLGDKVLRPTLVNVASSSADTE